MPLSEKARIEVYVPDLPDRQSVMIAVPHRGRSLMPQMQYSLEEIGQIGEQIYQRDIRNKVMPGEKGKFLILDIESGDYEVDEDDLRAEERLRDRHPDLLAHGEPPYPVTSRNSPARCGGRCVVSGERNR